MNSQEFEKGTPKERAEYIKSVMNGINFDENNDITNLYFIDIHEKGEYHKIMNPSFDWCACFYKIMEDEEDAK